MRHAVRPFIKEYKNRSSKSVASRPVAVNQADVESAQPSLVDSGSDVAYPMDRQYGYRAALQEAEELFRKRNPTAARIEDVPPSSVPTGRVLPSLVQEDDALTVRLREAAEKSRRGGGGRKTVARSPARREQPDLQPAEETIVVCVEQPQADLLPAPPSDSSPPREHEARRRRWAHNAEFKPGERWKRRLCKAAR
jgi:hypothetical protein